MRVFIEHTMLPALLCGMIALYVGVPELASSLDIDLANAKPVDVSILVLDPYNRPVESAQIRAFSEDWRVRYPFDKTFLLTDATGKASLRLLSGNWSFFIGGGDQYTTNHPGQGYFVSIRNVRVTESMHLTARPHAWLAVEAYSVNDLPLEVDNPSVYVMDAEYVPFVRTPMCGNLQDGRMNLAVTSGHSYTIAVVKFPSSLDPSGYICQDKNVPANSLVNFTCAADEIAHLRVETYSPTMEPTKSYVWFILPYLNLDRSEYGFFYFRIDGEVDIYLTPDKIGACWNYIPPGEWYGTHIVPLDLAQGVDSKLEFGGPLSADLEVRDRMPGWEVPSRGPEMWLRIADPYGHLLKRSSPTTEFPIVLTRNDELVYSGDLGAYRTKWLDEPLEQPEQLSYSIAFQLGVYGDYHLEGQLYSADTLMQFEERCSDHIVLHTPPGFSQASEECLELLEQGYCGLARALDGDRNYKVRAQPVFDVLGGTAGGGYINIGFTMFQSFGINLLHVQFARVFLHELGHTYTGGVPHHNPSFGSERGGLLSLLCETQANLLAEQVCFGEVYGGSIAAKYAEALHRIPPMQYLMGELSSDDGIRTHNLMFLFSYLIKKYGWQVEKDFFRTCYTMNSNYEEVVNSVEISPEARLASVLSHLCSENLGWLFRKLGFEMTDGDVDAGMTALSEKGIKDLQMVSEWMVIGPFAHGGWEERYPLDEQMDMEKTYEGKAGEVSWLKPAGNYTNGYIDLHNLLGPGDWVSAYALAYVFSPTARSAQLRIGSDDDVNVWLNDELVLSRYVARGLKRDNDSADVILKPGWNELLAKVYNRTGDWSFCCRICDADGRPFVDLSYSTETPCPWDVDGSGTVDIADIMMIVMNFGKPIVYPLPGPDAPNPDVNGDGVVDFLDIVLVAMHFGETYPNG